MSLGDAWASKTVASAAKLNEVTTINGIGSYLASLDKTKHKLVICTSTGSGFTLDHVYLFSEDGTTAIDLSTGAAHTHIDSSTGGSFMDIISAYPNPDIIDSGGRYIHNMDKADWRESVSGTGTITNDIDGTTGEKAVLLETGATSASTARIRASSIQMDMSKRSFFKCLMRTTTNSAIAFRWGYGAESLDGADNNIRKYGVELCTTTNNNFHVFSATGSARSLSDTGTAFSTSRVATRCTHFPDLGTPKVDTYIDEGTVFTKTSNIPTTNAADEPANDNIFSVTLKNSAAANKNLYVYGTRFAFQSSSTWK